MNMKTPKRIIGALLSLAVLFSLLPSFAEELPLAAAEQNEVVSEPDSRIMMQYLDAVEDDFNRATVDWSVGGGTAEAVTALDTMPYSVFEGSRSLYIKTENYTAGQEITLTKKPESLSAPERFRTFACAVWIPAEAGDARVSLTVTSKGGSYTGTAAVSTGSWQAVYFDLSESSLSGKVSSLSIAVSGTRDGDFAFLLDVCGASESEQAVFALRYMTSAYTAVGCELIQTGGTLSVSLGGTEQYIEAEAPAVSDFSGGAGIRIRLRNFSTCRSLTLSYTTLSSSEYTEKLSLTEELPEGEDTVSVTFPIPDSYIGKFRISFDGLCTGSIEILSVTPAACYTSPTTLGTISECRISRDKKTVGIKGQISEADAARYADSTLYLYELSLWEEISSVSTSRAALAETVLNGSEFTFSIPLSDSRNELYKKYAVMIYYGGGLIPVGSPISVTNPEALAGDSLSFADDSIKGYYPIEGTPVLDGIAHTAVEIRLDELMTLSVTNSMTHTTGGVSCTLDAGYVEALDQKMSEYEESGIAVNFILRLGIPEDISLGAMLCHPKSTGGSYSAFNTTSEEGIGALRALCDFLVSRYASSSGITSNAEGFVVGSGINDAAVSYNMGDTGLVSFTKAYSAALRTVYNAVTSVSSGVSVYMPLGGAWYSGMTVTQTSSFDARTVLEAVSACIEQGGDINWKLSYDICREDGGFAWEEATSELSEEAASIEASNLEVLTDYLENGRFLYNGSERSLLLLETEPHTADDANSYILYSADFVYTYLKLCRREFDSVKAYIPAHPVDYNETLRYIDTNRFTEVTEYAKELMGEELFEALRSGPAASPAGRYLVEKAAVSTVPSAVKGETVLFGFEQEEAGFVSSLNCSSVKANTSLEDKSGLLSVRFSAADAGEYRGIVNRFEKALDLSAAEYLGFEVQAAVLPENVSSLEITVVLWSGNSCSVSVGTVAAGGWSTVIADLSDFSGITSCDKMSIYVRGIDGQEIGEPTLLLGSIRIMSTVHSGEALDTAIRPHDSIPEEKTVSLYKVLAVGGVLILAVVIETARIFGKKSSKEEH